MTLLEATKTCFQKCFTFSGRASRPEFWKFVLFTLIVSVILTVVNSMIFGPTVEEVVSISVNSSGEQTQMTSLRTQYHGGLFGNIFSLICLIPFIAAGWRRMHDTGRPGWLMVVLPVTGIAIAFAIIAATSQAVPIDTSNLPEGTAFPAEIDMPQSGWAFAIAWLIAVSSFVTTIVFLAGASNTGENKYGPEPG